MKIAPLFGVAGGGEESIFLFPSFGRMGGRKPGCFTKILLLQSAETVKTRFLCVKSASGIVPSAECFLPDYDRLSTAASKRRLPS